MVWLVDYNIMYEQVGYYNVNGGLGVVKSLKLLEAYIIVVQAARVGSIVEYGDCVWNEDAKQAGD